MTGPENTGWKAFFMQVWAEIHRMRRRKSRRTMRQRMMCHWQSQEGVELSRLYVQLYVHQTWRCQNLSEMLNDQYSE
jgi:hypothetical protein